MYLYVTYADGSNPFVMYENSMNSVKDLMKTAKKYIKHCNIQHCAFHTDFGRVLYVGNGTWEQLKHRDGEKYHHGKVYKRLGCAINGIL